LALNTRHGLLWATGAVVLALAGQAGLRFITERGAAQELSEPADPAHTVLQAQVRQYPRDGRAWVLLARSDAQAGRHGQAALAYAKALDVSRKVAGDPSVWVEYAEARALDQGGSLAGEPVRLLERALALRPTHPGALDLAGSAAWETGDYRQAAIYWRRLQQVLPADSPRHTELAAALQTAERRARLSLR
jgi:cytochrome c-type biogenesis protein CcmH